jgi:hypothetical protein
MSHVLTSTVRSTDDARITFRKAQILLSVRNELVPVSLFGVFYFIPQVRRPLRDCDSHEIFQGSMELEERRI